MVSVSWVLPADILASTPSEGDGVEPGVEKMLRTHACELIQEACILLRLPQVAACTGQALLHRFYYKRSMVKHDVRIMAGACIFAAAKYEECGRRLNDVLNVLHDMFQRRDNKPREPLIMMSKDHTDLKNEVVKAERHLLRVLGFILTISHPHKFIPNLMKILDTHEHHDFMQLCWSFCNDSCRTDLCVRMEAHAIACGAVFLAARHKSIPLPENPPWWELLDCTTQQIDLFTQAMTELYGQSKTRYIPPTLLKSAQLTAPTASPRFAAEPSPGFASPESVSRSPAPKDPQPPPQHTSQGSDSQLPKPDASENGRATSEPPEAGTGKDRAKDREKDRGREHVDKVRDRDKRHKERRREDRDRDRHKRSRSPEHRREHSSQRRRSRSREHRRDRHHK